MDFSDALDQNRMVIAGGFEDGSLLGILARGFAGQ